MGLILILIPCIIMIEILSIPRVNKESFKKLFCIYFCITFGIIFAVYPNLGLATRIGLGTLFIGYTIIKFYWRYEK